MPVDFAVINDLVLELSLASALPVGLYGRNLRQAASAANSFAYHAEKLAPKELKHLEYAIGPLLILLHTDIDHPVSAKAALGLRFLMASRVCILRFTELDGLLVISRIFDILTGYNMIDFETPSVHRSIVEHGATCYREVGRFYPWKIVDVGALRHLVVLMRFGDVTLKTIACMTLAMCSQDMGIVKQMFSYGCIKPLINAAESTVTNEACTLAALGCLVQLCKVPEFAGRIVQQGALKKFDKALHTMTGFCNKSIREKALYCFAWLSRVESVKRLICTEKLFDGMRRELEFGTKAAQLTIVQMMLNLHNQYQTEEVFVTSVRDLMLKLMNDGLWYARNLCVKTIIVLYKSLENKIYMAKNGAIEAVLFLISSKSSDLQEATVVSLLSLISHPEVPEIFLEIGGAEKIIPLLATDNEIVRELTVVLLKALALYDAPKIKGLIPETLTHLMETDDIPQRYGGEYGGLIEEYLQDIVDNRRSEHYLLKTLSEEEVQSLQVTDAELTSYENTFMELDMDCSGALGLDEMKMLMVMLGETFDKDELQELLEEYDSDKSGELEFNEFVVMMKGWNTRLGTGVEKMYNEAFKRGAIGRARREFTKWWTQGERDQ
jgi:hypothetical protein